MNNAGTYTAPVPPGNARDGRVRLPLLLSAAVIAALGAAHGGYFASSWGWAALASVAALGWALGSAAGPSSAEVVLTGGLVAGAGLCALSTVWGAAAQTADETQRALVYAAVVGCVVALVQRVSASALVAGLLTGASGIASYALATRLFPDRVGTFDSIATYRLSTPIGYWNALGLLCTIGLIVALTLAAATSSRTRAALAVAPAPILAATLYFTFSRGSLLSLAVGAVVALALARNRLRVTGVLIAVGVPAAIGVAVGSRSPALTHQKATLARAAHDGHRLALILLGLVVASALLAAMATAIPTWQTAERACALALTAAAVAVVVGVVAHFGGPQAAAERAWHSFDAPPPKTQVDLSKRLFSFSSNGRIDLWRAAIHDFESHPLLGSGAGSYEQYWLQHRTTPMKVKDAHSLYLETLAELGIVGLVLLLIALLTPLVVGIRRRNVLTGAYVAYLVGAGIDWDWEITSVTTAALLIGVAILAQARSADDEARMLSPRARYGILATAFAIGAFGFVFLVGNMFLSRASAAASSGKWTTAATDARRAASWLPWSTDPQRQLGEAQLAQGNTTAARASFEAAIKKDSTDWNLWLDLARASTGSEQTNALRKATRLNPLSPEVAAFKSELGSSGGIDIAAGNP